MIIVFAPTIVFYSGVTTSLALGATAASALVILVVAAYPVGLGEPLARATAYAVAIMLVLGVHLLIAGLLHVTDFPHAMASFAPLPNRQNRHRLTPSIFRSPRAPD